MGQVDDVKNKSLIFMVFFLNQQTGNNRTHTGIYVSSIKIIVINIKINGKYEINF